jgi:hypothetical protein
LTTSEPARSDELVIRRPFALAIALLVVRPAGAFVLGGGFADTDCTIAFGGVDANAGESGVVCVDGDPACDADGAADGVCSFAVSLCSHVTADGCGTRDVDAVRVSGLALEAPPLDAAGACGATSAVTVATGQATGVTAIARGGAEVRDVDYLNLCCVPAAGTADAAACAVAADLAAAGCMRVPPGVKRPFLKARRAIVRVAAGADAPHLVKQARRALDRARDVAQRFAQRDPCGNALGLIARHAADVLPAP